MEKNVIIIKEHSFKIVVLSENIRIRDIIVGKLRIKNLHVELANGGFHLLNLLESFPDEYEMIIIHQHMVDMSAFEIITLIRLHKSKAQLPILFISNRGSDNDIYEMILNGANEYIVLKESYQTIIECALKYSKLSKKNAA